MSSMSIRGRSSMRRNSQSSREGSPEGTTPGQGVSPFPGNRSQHSGNSREPGVNRRGSWGQAKERLASKERARLGKTEDVGTPERTGSTGQLALPAFNTGLVRRRMSIHTPSKKADGDGMFARRGSSTAGMASMSVEGAQEWQEAQEEKRRRIHRELKLEIDVVKCNHLPKMDFFGLCDCYIKVTYGKHTYKTRVVRGSLNPTWEHTFIFSYNPQISEVYIEAVYYSGRGRHDTIGVAEMALKTELLQDEAEVEEDLSIADLDGHEVKGENAQRTVLATRQRLTDRTFNVTLPPYKFKATARFIDQKDVSEDGPTPKQFAHNRAWRVPTFQESLDSSKGKGLVHDLMKVAMERTKAIRTTWADGEQALKITWQERLQQKTDAIEMQIFVMVVVMVDLLSVFLFQFGNFVIAEDDEDCFERDLPPMFAITVTVMSVYAIEVSLRILAHGRRFFQSFWNVLDLVFVIFSLVPAFIKIFDDYNYDTKSHCNNTELNVPAEIPYPVDCQYPTILRSGSDLCIWLLTEAIAVGSQTSMKELAGVSASSRVISRIAVAARFIRAFIGMNRARRLRGQVVTQLQNLTRQAVGGTKRRYTRDGFDLDLTYVTDRCIAMSTPGFGGHKNYRNDIQNVARYLNLKHYGKYRVYNLCEEHEGNYHPALLYYQMRRIAFDDHNPPTMKQIMLFCHSAVEFMALDKQHVIAIHCKGGKGRTGVMALAWLLISGHRSCVVDGLELFAFRRTNKYKINDHHNQTVEGPSQIRYCHYLEATLYTGQNPVKEPQMLLVGVRFPCAPGKPNKKCYLSLVVLARGATVYDSRFNGMQLPGVASGQEFSFRIPTVVVRGDTKVEIYRHKSSDPRSRRLGSSKYSSKQDVWPFCQVIIHTAFHETETEMLFTKFQIDYSHKDRSHHSYPEDFSMVLNFSRPTRSDDHSGDVSSMSVVAERGRNLNGGGFLQAKSSFNPVIQIAINDVERTSDKAKGTFDPEWGQEFAFISPPPEINIGVKITNGGNKEILAVGTLDITHLELESAKASARSAHDSGFSAVRSDVPKMQRMSGVRTTSNTSLNGATRPGRVESVVNAIGALRRGGIDSGDHARRTHERTVPLKNPKNGQPMGEVDLTWSFDMWSTPEEYWEMKRFCQMVRKYGELRVVRAGEEIVGMGWRQTKLYLVAKGIVQVQIKNRNEDEEAVVVTLLGEDEIFGYSGLLAGLPLMQHIAHTDVEIRVVEISTRTSAGAEKVPTTTAQQQRLGSLACSSSAALGKEVIIAGFPEEELSFFFKALALKISEHFLVLKSETLRVSSRTVQSDNEEALRLEQLKDTIRHTLVAHFNLPATDQCRFIAQMVQVTRPENDKASGKRASEATTTSTVRVIFMTSAFILEPTLYGTELMDATRQDYYDLRRIIRVWIPVKKTAEESSHELCVSVLDPWAFYDATALGFGRHNIQTLRFVFPTASICAKSLGLFTAMAMEAARKRSLQRGMQSSRFNNDNPHLEPVLEEAVERGGARTFAPNQIIVGMNSDAHGNLYHVVRGSALVTSEDVPPKVLWTVVAGQMYGENQFLSGAHTGFFTVRAGDQGCELVIMEKELLLASLENDGDGKGLRELFRGLATKLAHRHHEELIIAYGSEWVHINDDRP